MNDSEIINQIAAEIKKANKIIIFHHIAPDGDSLGTALGLREMIEQINTIETVDNVITSYIPEMYKYLPDINEFKSIKDPTLYNSYDLGIAVDCANKDRLGDAEELFNRAKRTICVDHHPTNYGFADIDFIESKASASGELIYKLIEPLGVKLNKNIAINIYTAILTDTGGFKFENTSSETLRICADLIDAGADPVSIYKYCYETKSLAMVKLHAKVIDQAIVSDDKKIIYGLITREMLDELEASDDFIDGITESMRQIKGLELALVFKETMKKTTRVSFRSNGLDVCSIASFFGGGGHKLASGCLIEKGIDEAVKDVIPVVKKQLEREELYF